MPCGKGMKYKKGMKMKMKKMKGMEYKKKMMMKKKKK